MVYEGISMLSYSMCCFIVNEEMKLEYFLFLPSWYCVARITRVFCVINVIMMDFQGLSYLKCHPSNTVAWVFGCVAWVFCCVAWVMGFVTMGAGFRDYGCWVLWFFSRGRKICDTSTYRERERPG